MTNTAHSFMNIPFHPTMDASSHSNFSDPMNIALRRCTRFISQNSCDIRGFRIPLIPRVYQRPISHSIQRICLPFGSYAIPPIWIFETTITICCLVVPQRYFFDFVPNSKLCSNSFFIQLCIKRMNPNHHYLNSNLHFT